MSKDTDAPNWVDGWSNCNLETAFNALAQVVERDVEQANRLPKTITNQFAFSFCRHYTDLPEQFVVTRKPPDNAYGFFTVSVIFEKTDHSIKIDYVRQPSDRRDENDPSLEVMPKWDMDSAICTLEVDKKIMDAWQISQRALSELFFNCH